MSLKDSAVNDNTKAALTKLLTHSEFNADWTVHQDDNPANVNSLLQSK